MTLVLLTGGARSGKSALALRLARDAGKSVVFIATAEPRDEEMTARIEQHRDERPEAWRTIEEPLALAQAIRAAGDDATIVVDCLTLWVANVLERGRDPIPEGEDAARAAATRDGLVVVVTNEVGAGIVPTEPLARAYRDALGAVNAAWANVADRALLVVAGRVLELERYG